MGEVLFKPATAGLSCPGLSQAVLTVVAGHPEHHLRRTLIENIFIFGGGSPCPGLRERLATDLKAIGPASVRCSSLRHSRS